MKDKGHDKAKLKAFGKKDVIEVKIKNKTWLNLSDEFSSQF